MSKLENIDPRTMVVMVQVRRDAKADKHLVESVRENGILEPVTGFYNGAGSVVVLTGHRRTLAAIEAGLETVPVFVREQEPSEAERIIVQVAENERRENLTEAENASALFELTQLVSDAQAAKRMHVSRKHVATVKSVMASEAAAAHLQVSLNLEEAAALAEFDGDAEAISRILNRGSWNSVAHVVEGLRQERAGAEALEQATATHTEAGRAIITDGAEINSTWQAPETALASRVEALNRPDGTEATEADANAVHLSTDYRGEVHEVLLIVGWHEAGYTDKTGRAATLAPTTQEEEEAAAQAKEARRTVIANNKAMEAANVVRRQWVTSFLTRKTLPKDMGMFVARALSQGNTTDPKAQAIAAELLGLESSQYRPVASQFEELAKRPEVITLALVIGTIEGYLDKTSWRNPSAITRAYLAQVITWGYEASQVETETAQEAA